MAVAEELVAVLKVDNSQLLAGLEKAQAGLQEMRKALGQTAGDGKKLAAGQESAGKAMEGAAQKAKAVSGAFKGVSGAFTQARSSFLSLQTILTGFLVGSGLSRLTQSVTRIANLSQVTGQSVGSIRALGNVFEQLGYSAGEADSVIGRLASDIAQAGYGGNMSPLLANMRAFGVASHDEKGTPRDAAEMLIEMGEAVKKASRDTAEARQRLMAMGFSHAQIAFMTADNNRQMLQEQKANAAEWEKQAERAKELNRYIKLLQQAFTDLGLQVLPIVTPMVTDLTGALSKAAAIAREHPEGLQMAIKAIGLAALAAKGPVGMLLATLLALKELYEASKGWLEEESDKPQQERDSAVQIRQNVVSGQGEAVDASQYDVDPKSKKTGDWATGLYQTANDWLDRGVGAFAEAWGKDPEPEKAGPGKRGEEKAAPGKRGEGKAQQALRFFQEKGYSADEARAIAANLQRESRFDSRAVGDGGKAYGIAQWHPDRQATFKQVMGKDIRAASYEEQLQFVDWELKNTHKKALEAMRRTQTLAGKTGAITRHYEIPADIAGESVKRAAIAAQYGYQPQMVAMAGSLPAQTINNHTTRQDIKNDVRVNVATVKEAREIISPYTTGQKVSGRMDSGTAV